MAIISNVYDELVLKSKRSDGTVDELAQWLRDRSQHVWPEPGAAVQAAYSTIANHVVEHHSDREYSKFLDAADGWLIAHAMALGGAVVTFELPQGPQAKIPTICLALRVECIRPYEMLRRLGVRFVVEG